MLAGLDRGALPNRTIYSSGEYERADGTAVVGALRTLDSTPFTVVIELPYDVVYHSIASVRRVVAVAVLVAIAIAIAAGVLLARRMTRPITALVSFAHELSQRHFDQKVTVRSYDELGVLGDALERAARDLQASEIQIQQEQAIRGDLRRYLPAPLVDQIVARKRSLALGGERREISVLFADVVGFTPLAEPHKLVAGQVVKLPVIEVKPDAELAAPRGRVEVRRAGAEEWTAGKAGEDLFRTWRVGTREKATATVRFADTSAIDLRENTVIVIFGPSAAQQRVLRTSVERGALRSRLAALDGGPRLAIEIAGGIAELGGGSAVIDVDAGETRLSNHSGKPAALATPRGRVVVTEDHGSKAQKNQAPMPPRPLPPRPAWVRPAKLVVSWRGQGASLRASGRRSPRRRSTASRSRARTRPRSPRRGSRSRRRSPGWRPRTCRPPSTSSGSRASTGWASRAARVTRCGSG